MKIKFLILTILAVFLVGAVNLSAFCIYNNTHITISVSEISGGKMFKQFYADIKPGKKACCNWRNKGCNKKGKKNSILKFLVSFANISDAKSICKKEIKAGGELIVTNKNYHYICRAKGY